MDRLRIEIHLVWLVALSLLTACTRVEDEPLPVDGETRFSVVTTVPAGTDVSGADVIRNAAVFFVAPSSGRFIKKVDAVILPGGSGVRVHTVIPATYAGQTVCAYFIVNASALSDPLDMEPESVFDVSRLDGLFTRDSLNGSSTQFVMSAKVAFRAGGTDMPGGDIKFDRTFAKVYIVPAEGMSLERQRELSVVSVEIVNGRTGGYLFREGIFPERSVSVLLPVNKTIDQMNIHKPVCYLYPDDGGSEGTHLIVKLQNNADGRAVTKCVLLRSRKNTAYKLTIAELPGEDGGYAVQVSDWEEDILLPDAGQGVLPSPLPDEGIDLLNAPDVFYYYNQLRDAFEKKLYRSMFDKANNFTEMLRPGERLIVGLTGDLRGRFTKEDFLRVSRSLLNDMAIVFNTGIITSYQADVAGRVISYRMDLIAMRPTFDMRTELVLSAARKLLNRIPPDLSEFEKVKTVHDLFLRSVSYGGMSSSFGGNIIGGLVTRKIVCEGYARTLQYLLQRVGIQAIFIGGDALFSNGTAVSHAWNIVRVDGKYYAIDATWNDGMAPDSDFVGYDYFLKSDTTMSRDHLIDMELPVPECPEDYPLPNF